MTLVVNLVRKVPSAKFNCCCWRNHRCDCHVAHTPKCNDPPKIGANYLKNTLLCFPCAAQELRQSLDLTLLTKWPVFLQNAYGNPSWEAIFAQSLHFPLQPFHRPQSKVLWTKDRDDIQAQSSKYHWSDSSKFILLIHAKSDERNLHEIAVNK